MPDSDTETRTDLEILRAALDHVPFDGWSDAALSAAARDAGVDSARARVLFPRGGLDLALAYHRAGDAAMFAALAAADLGAMRFRDRVACALRLRLEQADRELVRRAATLMALPHNAPEAARAMWNTADAIWNALGDTSTDGNWYSKRAILSAVWSATVLYWLGDDSEGSADTWAFVDRRIADVMRFEQSKARVKASPVLRGVFGLPFKIMETIRKPSETGPMPGSWRETGPDGARH